MVFQVFVNCFWLSSMLTVYILQVSTSTATQETEDRSMLTEVKNQTLPSTNFTRESEAEVRACKRLHHLLEASVSGDVPYFPNQKKRKSNVQTCTKAIVIEVLASGLTM